MVNTVAPKKMMRGILKIIKTKNQKNENSRNFGKSRKMEVSRADLTGAPPSSYEGGTPVEACRPGDISDFQKCLTRPSSPTLEPSEEKTHH